MRLRTAAALIATGVLALAPTARAQDSGSAQWVGSSVLLPTSSEVSSVRAEAAFVASSCHVDVVESGVSFPLSTPIRLCRNYDIRMRGVEVLAGFLPSMIAWDTSEFVRVSLDVIMREELREDEGRFVPPDFKRH